MVKGPSEATQSTQRILRETIRAFLSKNQDAPQSVTEPLTEATNRQEKKEKPLIEASRYYHGSPVQWQNVSIGDEWKARRNEKGRFKSYVQELGMSFEEFFELRRPSNKVSRLEAIFMTKQAKMIQTAGGSTDCIFIMEPTGPVTRVDFGWFSAAQIYVWGDDIGRKPYDDYLKTYGMKYIDVADLMAKYYWNGKDYKGPRSYMGTWEYLTSSARIVKHSKSSDEKINRCIDAAKKR
jgi:hypothetical protein